MVAALSERSGLLGEVLVDPLLCASVDFCELRFRGCGFGGCLLSGKRRGAHEENGKEDVELHVVGWRL